MTTAIIDEYRKIKRGDIITLCDEQTIKQLMEDGVQGAMNGMDLEVKNVRRVDFEDVAQFYFCDLGGQPEGQPPLVLMVKVVDDEIDRRIYWAPDYFQPGSRGDLVNNDCLWLFQEPTSKDNFIPAELKFTTQIFQNVEGQGEVCYQAKGSEIHGEHHEVSPGGSKPQPATIVEWLAEAEVENPELIILEVGGLDEYGERLDEGGYVIFLQGAAVGGADIKLLSK